MVHAIAKQAEAQRDRRAKIIHAEAEFQASQTVVNTAKILSSIPATMQLRYPQTLTEIGAEQNSTVVLPMPIDIIKPFLELLERPGKPAGAGANGADRAPLMKDIAPLNAQGSNPVLMRGPEHKMRTQCCGMHRRSQATPLRQTMADLAP